MGKGNKQNVSIISEQPSYVKLFDYKLVFTFRPWLLIIPVINS